MLPSVIGSIGLSEPAIGAAYNGVGRSEIRFNEHTDEDGADAWPNSKDQPPRESLSAASNGRLGDLERAISQLRETRGIDQPREMTIAHLIEAVEAAGRAIKEERWAREGYSEFLGE